MTQFFKVAGNIESAYLMRGCLVWKTCSFAPFTVEFNLGYMFLWMPPLKAWAVFSSQCDRRVGGVIVSFVYAPFIDLFFSSHRK